MVDERVYTFTGGAKFVIEVCNAGFLVIGDKYGGGAQRAFSTAEGLIEWLSRELGAGPIVWAITYEIWMGLVDIKPGDLLDLPDHATDPVGYQETIKTNAAIIIAAYVRKQIAAGWGKEPPEPKPKKEKKVKEEKPVEEVKEE